MKHKTLPTLDKTGGLITYRDDSGCDCCLGYLFHFPDKGIFDPTFGKLDLTPEDVHIHNTLLAVAEIEGLDKNCAVGMRGCFYYRPPGPRNSTASIRTWTGTLVSDDVRVTGKTVTFHRAGKTYRGRLRKDADLFNFRRIA